MLDLWSVYLPLYKMKTCRTRDLCIWHYTEWLHVGLVICIWHYTEWWWTCDLYIWHLQNDTTLDSWSASDIIQNDDGLVICISDIYRMTPRWTRDLCIWHYTEWLHVGLVICIWHYIEWRHVGLVICVSDIIHDDAMLDSWSVYLTFYRMTPCWTRDLCIWHYTEWCWTRDLCIWHYTEWRHVGLVICVSDIIQNEGMLDLWSVYLPLYRMTTCWTRDLCIWHYTEWLHVGLVIVYLTLYRMTPCWTNDLFI